MANLPNAGLGVGARTPTSQVAEKQGADLKKLSYGDLAVAKTQPRLEKVISRLSRITENAQPHDPQLKELRKDMQRLRDELDVFAFAWGTPNRQRQWVALRDRLDEGYETLGHFKDLFDSQGLEVDANGNPPAGTKYDRGELKDWKQALLRWKESFTKNGRLDDAKALVANPAAEPASIPQRELSKFFWGGVDVRPDPSATGLQNVANLARAMSERARTDLDDAVKLDDLHRPKVEEQFHDARKRFRSLSNLFKTFPELTGGRSPDAVLETVDDAVKEFGKIEDRLVAYHLAKDDGKKGNAGEIKDDIAARWKALTRTLSDGKLDQALRELGRSVQP